MPPVVGLTLRNIVMVDLDGMPLEKVRELADKALKRFRLGAILSLKAAKAIIMLSLIGFSGIGVRFARLWLG